MSRSPALVLQEILQLMQPGAAWSDDPESNLGLAMTALANGISRMEASCEALLPECDPRSTTQLITDWERMLGTDPCLPDPSTQTLAQRRLIAWWRYTDAGGNNAAYFIALAAFFGVTISIANVRRGMCGLLRCGSPLTPSPNQFCWIVTLPQSVVTRFRTGASMTGQSLGAIAASFVACLIAARAPAHTTPVFSYTGAA